MEYFEAGEMTTTSWAGGFRSADEFSEPPSHHGAMPRVGVPLVGGLDVSRPEYADSGEAMLGAP